MRSVVSMLLPSSWFRIHWRTPEYTASERNSDSVSEVNWPSENTATKSRSSEVATVLIAASSENSRMKFCERARNGTSSSSEPRNTYQTIEPMSAMLCGMPGRRDAVPIAIVSSAQVDTATTPKRRNTIANGCGSIWYDQLNKPIATRPRTTTPPCVHHHACGSRPSVNRPTSSNATDHPPIAIQPEPGRRRGCRQVALTMAAAVIKSKAMRTGMSSRGKGAWKPSSSVASTAMHNRLADWHQPITA